MGRKWLGECCLIYRDREKNVKEQNSIGPTFIFRPIQVKMNENLMTSLDGRKNREVEKN